ncbi:MAG: hypothetical protein ABR970_18060 [Roseiarcus sp.]|jgi:hypothetical protein
MIPLLSALAFLAKLSQGVVVFLAWELAWRDYGARAAMLAFAVAAVIAAASCWGRLLFDPALAFAAHDPGQYVPPGLFKLAATVVLSYATGGLTRRLFGAGRKYSLALPALAD